MVIQTKYRSFYFCDKVHILRYIHYNPSENRRLIGGIIMAHNLMYTKCGDYYIMKIAIRC